MKKSTVIYGPPGTGKSTEIIRRMKQAIDNGVDPKRIGLCSFTKAAASELARRVGVKPGQNIATLHSYAFRLCELIREQVVDKAKLAEFSKISKIETTGANIYEQETLGPGDYYLAMYGYMRATLKTNPVDAYRAGSKEGTLEEFIYFIDCYDQWKRANGYMDFSDMLTEALSRPAPEVDILFLDEAQDFGAAQWKLIDSWVPYIGEIVLALDDDQTLYKFTGADPLGGPNFERKYGSERVVLNKSYRVPGNIHALATKFIRNVTDRVEKQYDPVAPGGQIRTYGSLPTVPRPAPTQDTLILYRNHALSNEIRNWLMERGVPFTIDNGMPGPSQSFLGNAVMIWKSAQRDHAEQGEIYLTPAQWGNLRKMAKPQFARAIGDGAVDHIIDRDWAEVLRVPLDVFSYFKKLEKNFGTIRPETKIHLSSIHGAKGREADRVILINGMSQKTAESYGYDPDPEIRAFYVGITRAKHELDIVYGENPIGGL